MMTTTDTSRPSKSTSFPTMPPLAMLGKENSRENIRKTDAKPGKEVLSRASRNSSQNIHLPGTSAIGTSPQLLRPRMSGNDSVTPSRSDLGRFPHPFNANRASTTTKKDRQRHVLRYGETVESLFCLNENSVIEHRRLCQNIVDGLILNEANSWLRALDFATDTLGSPGQSRSSGLDLIRLHRRATSRCSIVSDEGENRKDILAMWLSYSRVQAEYGSREEARLTFRHIQNKSLGPLDASFYLALSEFERDDDIEQSKVILRLGITQKAEPVQKLKEVLEAMEKTDQRIFCKALVACEVNSSIEKKSDVYPFIPPLPSRSSVDRSKKRRGSYHSKVSPKKSRSQDSVYDSSTDTKSTIQSGDADIPDRRDNSMSNMSLDKSNMSIDTDISLSTSLSENGPVMTNGLCAENTLLPSQGSSEDGLRASEGDQNKLGLGSFDARKQEPVSKREALVRRRIAKESKSTKANGSSTSRNTTVSRLQTATSKTQLLTTQTPKKYTSKYQGLRAKQSLLSSNASRLTRVGLSGKAQRVHPEQAYVDDSAESVMEVDEKEIKFGKSDPKKEKLFGDSSPSQPIPKITKMDLNYMLNWDPTTPRGAPGNPVAPVTSTATSANRMKGLSVEKIDEMNFSVSTGSKSAVSTSSTMTSYIHSSERKAIHINDSQRDERMVGSGGSSGQSIPEIGSMCSNSITNLKPELVITPETAAMVAKSNSDFLPLVSEDNILRVNDIPYVKLGVIGKGGSCKVYRALSKECSVLAIKKVKLGGMDRKAIDGYANEIALLKRLRGNPAIIQMLDSEVDISRKAIFLVMEVGEVDLNQVLHQQTLLSANKVASGSEHPRLNMNFIRLTWQQMLSAVHCIHEERIIHGDLKPANFLFVRGALKLIDFGIAKAMQSDDTTNIYRESQIGTLNYMSPEAILDTGSGENGARMKCGRASDIWSLGCILYQMVYGRTPFAELHMIQKLQAIINSNHDIRFTEDIDASAMDAMKLCLRRDPDERPPIVGEGGLLNEHWFLHSSRKGNRV